MIDLLIQLFHCIFARHDFCVLINDIELVTDVYVYS